MYTFISRIWSCTSCYKYKGLLITPLEAPWPSPPLAFSSTFVCQSSQLLFFWETLSGCLRGLLYLELWQHFTLCFLLLFFFNPWNSWIMQQNKGYNLMFNRIKCWHYLYKTVQLMQSRTYSKSMWGNQIFPDSVKH